MATLNFKGKPFVQNYHLSVKYHQLIPRKNKSLTKKVSLHDNLIIHGDNLKGLKALLPTYAGKIKCIYIDPPYNTGNEKWAYNDNVNSPMMQDWLGKVVDKEDLTRHDKWLCMMTPRLKLLRELLTEDGIIFVSIDDNAAHYLRMLMDEVFGEAQFVAKLVWNTEGHTDNQYHIKVNHEYVLVYVKNSEHQDDAISFVVDPNTKRDSNLWKGYAENSITKNGPGNPPTEVELPPGFPCLKEDVFLPPTEVPKDFFRDVSILGYISREITKKYRVEYPVRKDEMVVRRGKLTQKCRVFTGWANLNKLRSFISNGFAPLREDDGDCTFYLSENGVIYYRKQREKARHILSVLRNMGTTEQMRYVLESMGIDFQYPKPLDIIKYLIQVGSHSDSVTLDSFSGSGTTAHAVLALNKEDGGNRKFILVECEDYADKITAERVRRVIKGVKGAKDENLKKGLGGTFSYFELGPPIEMESILSGDNFPSYMELARYVFYTATGEEFDPDAVDEKKNFIGQSAQYLVYLFYKPDMDYLKATALTLDRATALGPYKKKRRLVFAPTKYLDQEHLDELRIDFAQLPFEIYQLVK